MIAVPKRNLGPTLSGFAAVCAMVCVWTPPALANDHFNLESGIPTSLEDIEPLERGSFELQGFGRYLRRHGPHNGAQGEPRVEWGMLENTQLEIATPLLAGADASVGNGDVRLGILRKFRDDRTAAWGPGFALAADVTLPTGVAHPGYTNRTDASVDVILKKDIGSHSLHLNAGFDWTRDESADERLRRFTPNIVAGHDMPLTHRIILVSDVVWHPADEVHAKDVWEFETGARAQITRSIIGAIGISAGLRRSEDTPAFSLTAGIQFAL